MNSSPNADNITELSKAIGDYKKDKNADQVLVLDWKQAALSNSLLFNAPNPYFGASWIPKVAEWTKKKLVDEWKISPDNINFAGHSLGSYLAWETAKNIGGVNNLIALDPALNYKWRIPRRKCELFRLLEVGMGILWQCRR
jgi:pimeloyl-ACP methyl ester carboxylesterase